MSNDFDDFYAEIEREAFTEGPDAVRDLKAKEFKYRLIASIVGRRHQLSLTQEGLARRSGLAQSEISKIERGLKSPTLDTFARLAVALDLDLDLGSGKGHPRSRPSSHRRAS